MIAALLGWIKSIAALHLKCAPILVAIVVHGGNLRGRFCGFLRQPLHRRSLLQDKINGSVNEADCLQTRQDSPTPTNPR
jgi:hypothetical protein